MRVAYPPGLHVEQPDAPVFVQFATQAHPCFDGYVEVTGYRNGITSVVTLRMVPLASPTDQRAEKRAAIWKAKAAKQVFISRKNCRRSEKTTQSG